MDTEVAVGSMGVPLWLILVALVAIGLAVFSLWDNVILAGLAAVKQIFGAVGKTVSPTIDSAIHDWLTTSKSIKTQGLLRLARLAFEEQGDAASAETIDKLIVKASTWKEQ